VESQRAVGSCGTVVLIPDRGASQHSTASGLPVLASRRERGPKFYDALHPESRGNGALADIKDTHKSQLLYQQQL